MIAALAFVCAALLWVALLYVEVLHWVESWGMLCVYEKGAALAAVPFC